MTKGAPKGNQFWKARAKHGRDKILGDPKSLWDACVEYFQWVEDNPLWERKVFATGISKDVPKMRAMTINGLCIFLDCSVRVWNDYKNKETHKDFLPVVTKAEEIIREQKFTGAAADLLNPNIIARDLGLADKSEVNNTGAVVVAKMTAAEYKAARAEMLKDDDC